MCRLGLPPAEVERLRAEPERLDGIVPTCLLSHLARADEADHPMNAAQLAAFKAALTALPRAPVSFCNSSGIFLGPDYHFDLGRPGVRSEEHTSELQSLMRISYAVFCLKKKHKHISALIPS